MINKLQNFLFIKSGVPKLENYLNLTALRHKLKAGNVANVATSGYKSRDISFEEKFKRLNRATQKLKGELTNPAHIAQGQRLGIFAGSGVGKSVMLGMMARGTSADINVIALIGERGREVREFIENDLGPEGMKNSIVVAVTSDKPPLIRIKGAMVATAIAEYFRDQGKNVLLLFDSLTRVSMAQREIGIAAGEPPTTKGYTPSVFAMLPALLERAGLSENGSITGFYAVSVEGDDFNEPIPDAVRSILDGHVTLSRKMASLNQYPAIDILDSVSRLMKNVATDEEIEIAAQTRKVIAIYREAEDLINIGAYVKGSNPEIDDSIIKYKKLLDFFRQGINEIDDYETSYQILKEIIKPAETGTNEKV